MNHVLITSDEQFFVILKQALLILRNRQLQRLHENISSAIPVVIFASELP